MESGLAGCTVPPLAPRIRVRSPPALSIIRPLRVRASRARTANEPPRTKVEALADHLKNETSMSYIEQFEVELMKKLETGPESTAEIVRWVSEKVLESYRNGITAGQKGATVKRQGLSRRAGITGRAK